MGSRIGRLVGSQQAVTPAGLPRRPPWPPLSLTLHPPGSLAFASQGSVAHFQVPINSFVCVLLQIDSPLRSRSRHLSTTPPALKYILLDALSMVVYFNVVCDACSGRESRSNLGPGPG